MNWRFRNCCRYFSVEEAGLPACFHIGEQTAVEGPGALFSTILNNLGNGMFRQVIGKLIFGGVFDRHPALQIVFVEAGLHWIPGMLQDAEMIVQSFAAL